MKYPFASRFVLLATIAISTIHEGIAVPFPGLASPAIAIQHQRKIEDDSSSTELHVDNEGNLYSSPTKTTHQHQHQHQRRDLYLYQLRGGEIFVDNEGNLFTPRGVLTSSAKKAAVAPIPIVFVQGQSRGQSRDQSRGRGALSKDLPSPTEALRGGSNNHNIGCLSVDQEGNLYATTPPSSGSGSCSSSALVSLRGGSLCVDREGNFYSPRNPETETANQQQGPAGKSHRCRRQPRNSIGDGDGDAAGPVLLAKNRLPKKTDAGGSKPKKPSASNNPMAFISYNNALMET